MASAATCSLVRASQGPPTPVPDVFFTRLFHEFGIPDRIRTDNGTPFASIALGRLSRLSVWWIKLGILPDLIEPASPQQNGRHERMHKDLKAEATIPPRRKPIRSAETLQCLPH